MTQQPSTARRLHPAHPAWGTRPDLALLVSDPASPQLEPVEEIADRRHLTLVSNPSPRSPR